MAHINKMPRLTIVIPTINEASRLPLLLADLNLFPYELELIVVDGGSLDSTVQIAKLGGAKVIHNASANRGDQLKKGALAAKGEWLLFLHSDCRLRKNWPLKIYRKIVNQNYKEYAWFFNFKVQDKGLIWRLLEFSVFIRSHLFQKPYGDQGLLISKDLYSKVGGYNSMQIMEDLDLIIRLGAITRLRGLGISLTTSSRKIRKSNVIQNAINNAILRYKWQRGEDIKKLAKKYYSSNEFKNQSNPKL